MSKIISVTREHEIKKCVISHFLLLNAAFQMAAFDSKPVLLRVSRLVHLCFSKKGVENSQEVGNQAEFPYAVFWYLNMHFALYIYLLIHSKFINAYSKSMCCVVEA